MPNPVQHPAVPPEEICPKCGKPGFRIRGTTPTGSPQRRCPHCGCTRVTNGRRRGNQPLPPDQKKPAAQSWRECRDRKQPQREILYAMFDLAKVPQGAVNSICKVAAAGIHIARSRPCAELMADGWKAIPLSRLRSAERAWFDGMEPVKYVDWLEEQKG